MPSIDVYEFRDPRIPTHDDRTMVCVLERVLADEFFANGEIEELFGGLATYKDAKGEAFVGVWGTRNTTRFRRFLRERGAELVIHRTRPLDLRLSHASSRRGNRPDVRTLRSKDNRLLDGSDKS